MLCMALSMNKESKDFSALQDFNLPTSIVRLCRINDKLIFCLLCVLPQDDEMILIKPHPLIDETM